MEEVLVLLLRRDTGNLTIGEIENLLKKFPGKKVTYQRTDPVDYLDHDRDCREL